MLWASTRKSTRIEDIADSLLGISSVGMPIIYGKRSERLQKASIGDHKDIERPKHLRMPNLHALIILPR